MRVTPLLSPILPALCVHPFPDTFLVIPCATFRAWKLARADLFVCCVFCALCPVPCVLCPVSCVVPLHAVVLYGSCASTSIVDPVSDGRETSTNENNDRSMSANFNWPCIVMADRTSSLTKFVDKMLFFLCSFFFLFFPRRGFDNEVELILSWKGNDHLLKKTRIINNI